MSRIARFSTSLMLVGVVSVGTVGCAQPSERLNAPPQGHSDATSPLSANFVRMVDSAMLEDMSLADIHFVAHTTELSGLGEYRLDRFAELLETYGGTLRYETQLTDEELISERIEHVIDYLATLGVDQSRISVASGISEGRGGPAEPAVIKTRTELGLEGPDSAGDTDNAFTIEPTSSN